MREIFAYFTLARVVAVCHLTWHRLLALESMRIGLIVVAWLSVATAKATQNPDFPGGAPPRDELPVDSDEVRHALRYVMTELKRLDRTYRYARLSSCHSAQAGEANFGGRNLFLDVEFDMLRDQPSRHDLIVFKDEQGVITGIAFDEFPEVNLRELPDPDVD